MKTDIQITKMSVDIAVDLEKLFYELEEKCSRDGRQYSSKDRIQIIMNLLVETIQEGMLT